MNEGTTTRCSEVTNQSFPFQEARLQNLGCYSCHFRGSTHRTNLSSYSATMDLSGSATKHHQNKCCSVMCNLKVSGMPGIQGSVIRKNNQLHRSCSRCSSTGLMHVKNEPQKNRAGPSQLCQLRVQVNGTGEEKCDSEVHPELCSLHADRININHCWDTELWFSAVLHCAIPHKATMDLTNSSYRRSPPQRTLI